MADSPLNALSSPAQTIGRYFSILSVVPSALLVTFFLVLDSSHAWSGHPDFGVAFSSLGDGGFTKVGQIVLASLLIGLILQPLQYTLVQLAEGYWGTSKLATALMRRRIAHHRRVRRSLRSIRDENQEALKVAGQDPQTPAHGAVTDDNQLALLRYEEASRALLSYPQLPNHVRPTRLGNVLRRYEAEGGAQYGLGIPTVAPHLNLVTPREHVEFLNDQRTQMDLAVRLAVISVIACVLGVAFLWRDGLWLLIAAVPYALAYVFYRGAVVVAADYGVALSTVVDVDRFLLYERLHLPAPATLAAERVQAAKLMTLLRTDENPDERATVDLTYAHSGQDAGSVEPTPGSGTETEQAT